ncbi:hypothetical protein RRG08_046973 [Elysia crispata]|uniref:Uncharacterized protein n=1 Tax=Elysia crispata TaxID=231223 RepID=A0AAE1DUA3_9GAST|nr:hypothetical protein RRG08_046973 [Elysia crispata]
MKEANHSIKITSFSREQLGGKHSPNSLTLRSVATWGGARLQGSGDTRQMYESGSWPDLRARENPWTLIQIPGLCMLMAGAGRAFQRLTSSQGKDDLHQRPSTIVRLLRS